MLTLAVPCVLWLPALCTTKSHNSNLWYKVHADSDTHNMTFIGSRAHQLCQDLAELGASSTQGHHAPKQVTDVVAQLSGARAINAEYQTHASRVRLAINAEHQTHASRVRLAINAEHQTHASRVRHTRALAAFLPDDRGVLAFLACLLWCHRGRSRQLTILRVLSYFCCCCCCCGWYRADGSSGLQQLGSLQGKGTATLYTDSARHRQASQLSRESTLRASRLATGDNRKGTATRYTVSCKPGQHGVNLAF